MAINKKNAKGNKTAHVLNLLTASDARKEGASAGVESIVEASAERAVPADAEPMAETSIEQPAAHSRPLLPPILEVAQSNDDSLAQQIQRALEKELGESSEAEIGPPPAQPARSVVEEAPSEVAEQPPAAPANGQLGQEEAEILPTDGISAEEPEPAPAGGQLEQEETEELPDDDVPAEEPEPEPAPAPAPAPRPQPPGEEEEDVTYTNVMQVLVEEKVPRYIQEIGLCTCKHCAADVKALTLSNLTPKYVVMSKQDRIPMLTVYEGRYSSSIFAQLARACEIVMAHPHHSRES